MLATIALATAPDGGSVPLLDPKDPATWSLSEKLPPGSPERQQVIDDWTRKSTDPGEVPLTPEEAEAILDDARAQHIYGERTVSIVAPSMLVRQRQEHLDLLARFMKPEQIDHAVAFFRAHQATLERVRDRHHVDPAVIVSILMWESGLGTKVGEYVAFNAFASQAFFIDEANALALARKDEKKLLDPDRQAHRVDAIRSRARANLATLVRVCKGKKLDPLSVKGSWAGALGYPQFMPASLRWAEDGDGDGKIDLYSFDDSIASVARYLDEHGFGKSRKRAVWEYNHEAAYVRGVLAFADAMTARMARGSPDGGAASTPDAGTPLAADAGP